MHTLIQDIRYGLRMLRKSPGFTTVVVLTLALGIGASTAIFSVIDHVLLQPLPFPEPDRLALMWELYRQDQEKSVAYLNYADWRDQNTAFDELAAYSSWTFTITGENPERIDGAVASVSLFPLLGITPQQGRTFFAGEDRPGAEAVAVISNGLWQRRFGGDPGVVGRTLTINGQLTTIIGVMPAAFQFPRSTSEIWMPIAPALARDGDLNNRNNHAGLYVVGRMKPDVPIERARNDMETISARLATRYPDTNADHSVRMISLHDYYVRDYRLVFLILAGAVAFVLLIACANVANLLITRAAAREKEMSIRIALGASRGRLIRQLLTESVLLSTMAGLCGLTLAWWGTGLISALVPSLLLVPGLQTSGIDGTALLITIGLALMTALMFGLAPALAIAGDTRIVSKDGRRATAGPARRRLSNTLVVAEIALSLILLIGAGLMIQSVQRLLTADPGFDPERVLTLQISPSGERYNDQEAVARFFQQTLERLAVIPGVQSLGAINPLPLSGSNRQTGIRLMDSPSASPDEDIRTDFAYATPGYFPTMRIALIQGRLFTMQDTPDAPPVAIIDETMARRYFPDQNPIGRQIMAGNQTREVVGVVKHVAHYGINAPSRIQMYVPHRQSPAALMVITLRTNGDPAGMIGLVRDGIKEVDPFQPVYNVRTMAQLVEASMSSERVTMVMLAVFAAVALILAMVGIYGVISFMVAQRTREIGIRMALGARPRDVLTTVLGHGLLLTLAGAGVGAVAALGLTGFLSRLLYGVEAMDPGTFAGLIVLLAGISMLACYLPARRAAKVDPMIALRYE